MGLSDNIQFYAATDVGRMRDRGGRLVRLLRGCYQCDIRADSIARFSPERVSTGGD